MILPLLVRAAQNSDSMHENEKNPCMKVETPLSTGEEAYSQQERPTQQAIVLTLQEVGLDLAAEVPAGAAA